MSRAELAVADHLVDALRALLAEHHDVEDTDHPQVQRPNWAMRATNLLDEVRAEFYESQR